MKLWADMYDIYLSEVRNCTYVSAANALRRASQEFCEHTKAWRVTMDTFVTAASGLYHDFDITSDQEVVKIVSATLDGKNLRCLLHDQADGQQFGLITLNPREFMIQPVPVAGLDLIINAVLKPSNISIGLEDYLYASYARTIAAGAKADLFGQLSMPYGNAEMADRERAKFEAEMNTIQGRVARAYSNAPLRTIPSFM